MVWIYVFIFVLIAATVGITLAIKLPGAMKEREKRLAAQKSGDFINRPGSFYKDEEIFTANIPDLAAFGKAMTEAVKKTEVCTFQGDYSSEVIYSGTNNSWRAHLVRLGDNRFSFGLMNYHQTQLSSTANIMALSADLNYVLTAIEKTFLQFDPNTKVEAKSLDLKTTYH